MMAQKILASIFLLQVILVGAQQNQAPQAESHHEESSDSDVPYYEKPRVRLWLQPFKYTNAKRSLPGNDTTSCYFQPQQGSEQSTDNCHFLFTAVINFGPIIRRDMPKINPTDYYAPRMPPPQVISSMHRLDSVGEVKKDQFRRESSEWLQPIDLVAKPTSIVFVVEHYGSLVGPNNAYKGVGARVVDTFVFNPADMRPVGYQGQPEREREKGAKQETVLELDYKWDCIKNTWYGQNCDLLCSPTENGRDPMLSCFSDLTGDTYVCDPGKSGHIDQCQDITVNNNTIVPMSFEKIGVHSGYKVATITLIAILIIIIAIIIVSFLWWLCCYKPKDGSRRRGSSYDKPPPPRTTIASGPAALARGPPVAPVPVGGGSPGYSIPMKPQPILNTNPLLEKASSRGSQADERDSQYSTSVSRMPIGTATNGRATPRREAVV